MYKFYLLDASRFASDGSVESSKMIGILKALKCHGSCAVCDAVSATRVGMSTLCLSPMKGSFENTLKMHWHLLLRFLIIYTVITYL